MASLNPSNLSRCRRSVIFSLLRSCIRSSQQHYHAAVEGMAAREPLTSYLFHGVKFPVEEMQKPKTIHGIFGVRNFGSFSEGGLDTSSGLRKLRSFSEGGLNNSSGLRSLRSFLERGVDASSGARNSRSFSEGGFNPSSGLRSLRNFLERGVGACTPSNKLREFVGFSQLRGLGFRERAIGLSLSSGSYGNYGGGGGSQLTFRRSIGGSSSGAVIGLILANLAVYSAWQLLDQRFMRNNFMISYENLRNHRYHTLITSAFSHQETYHLLSNMLGLYFFGSEVAYLFGGNYLVGLYLISGVAASLCHVAYVKYIYQNQVQSKQGYFFSRFYDLPALGASGAVNAVVLLDCLLFPSRIVYLNFFIPVPAILLGLGFILHDLYGVTNTGGRVGHAAHLGGASIGVIAWMILRKGRF